MVRATSEPAPEEAGVVSPADVYLHRLDGGVVARGGTGHASLCRRRGIVTINDRIRDERLILSVACDLLR